MAQFDVYVGRGKNAKYLIDLQDNILDTLTTRIVAPLVPLSYINLPIKNVNPVIHVNDEKLILLTHLLAAIPCRHLEKFIVNVKTQRNDIVAALVFIRKQPFFLLTAPACRDARGAGRSVFTIIRQRT